MTQARGSVSGGEAAAALAGRPRRAPAESYPDPAIEILDPSLAKSRLFNAAVEPLAGGFRRCEGRAWFGDGRHPPWINAFLDGKESAVVLCFEILKNGKKLSRTADEPCSFRMTERSGDGFAAPGSNMCRRCLDLGKEAIGTAR